MRTTPPQTPDNGPARYAAKPHPRVAGNSPGSPPEPVSIARYTAVPFPEEDRDANKESAAPAAAVRVSRSLSPPTPALAGDPSSPYSTRSGSDAPANLRLVNHRYAVTPSPPFPRHPAPVLPPVASHPLPAGCPPRAIPPSTVVPIRPAVSACQRWEPAAVLAR